MTCQEFEELSGAYALGATTPEENLAAEAHLAECHRCTHLLRELQDVVDLLPLTVPDATPSPQLRNRILTSIQDEATNTPVAQKPLLQFQPPASYQRQVRPASQRRRQRWQLPTIAVAAAVLLALFAGMLTWNLSLRSQNTALQQQNLQLQQKAGTLASQNAKVVPTTYAIHGTNAAQASTGQVYYYPEQNITVLVVHGLPQISGNQVYQGWLIQNNQPKSIGLFNVQHGTATLNFQGDLKGYAVTAISLEKGPGATPVKPAGQIVAEGTLSNQ